MREGEGEGRGGGRKGREGREGLALSIPTFYFMAPPMTPASKKLPNHVSPPSRLIELLFIDLQQLNFNHLYLPKMVA